jgi:hypothetical protein
MGMYTELLLKCRIKMPEINSAEEKVIKLLFYKNYHSFNLDVNLILPSHDFFKCHNWSAIGNCSSYYHHPDSINSLVMIPAISSGIARLFSRSDLKNYEDEIQLFLNWFMPFVDEKKGSIIGWTWYEEDEEPTLIRKE